MVRSTNREAGAACLLLLAVALGGCHPRSPSAAPGKPAKASSSGGTAAVSQQPPPATPSAVLPLFTDVTSQAGLDKTVLYCGGPSKNHILESVGSGVALVDFDNDGWLDVYLVNAWVLDESQRPSKVAKKGRCALYRNLGNGRFEDVTQRAGVGGDDWGCGVAAGDYDNDGRVDLFVTNFGACKLYRNRGDGTFEDATEKAGLAAVGWWSGASLFDADGDDWLDLYVASYIDCTIEQVLAAERTTTWRNRVKVMEGPFGMRGGKDRFYRNRGDGTFVDATEAAGMADVAESYGLTVLAADLDLDGDVDVYVANDSNPNFLYRNEGDGKFKEIGGWSGAGVNRDGKAQAGMGVDSGDLDGDGLPEIFVTNFAQDYSTLYRNHGKLFFSDVTVAQGMKQFVYEQVSWGCALFDVDNDGDLDLVVLNGHIYPQVETAPDLKESYRQKPGLLRNDGGPMTDVSRQAGPGMQWSASARGLAVGDIDNDGDLDLVVTAIDSPPLVLRNDTPARGHWLELRLLNRHGSAAIGARATITAGGKTQMCELRSGGTYCSQSSFDLHFGLGSTRQIDRLEVAWPGGAKTVREKVAADKLLELRQGDDGKP